MADLPKYEPVTVRADDTLETVINITTNKKIHRVYLVDNDFKPIGVISLGDIIRAFVPMVSP